MCGRYTLMYDPEELQSEFDLVEVPEDYTPRYNIAPSQEVLTITSAEPRKAQLMRWGLVPFWAKDESIGNKMINARSETVQEKPSFRNAFGKRRCLVLADGFYEWKRGAKAKTSIPFFFRVKGGVPFAFAGLWETWGQDKDNLLHSCTILTTAANELVGEVHERMPVMLSGEKMGMWLSDLEPAALQALCAPYAAGEMESWEVSTLVNSPANDRAGLVEPARNSLF